MQPNAVVEEPGPPRSEQETASLNGPAVLASLFAIAGQVLNLDEEESQLTGVIHLIFSDPGARRRLEECPATFIASLEVAPRVRAVLGMMTATLVEQRVVASELAEFSWWWGGRSDPGPGVASRPVAMPSPYQRARARSLPVG